MSNDPESKSLEQLMAEADELLRKINSDVVRDMKEEHRLQFEKHAHHLDKIKSEVLGKTEKAKPPEITTSTEGIHEAILDIVKAFRELKTNIS